MTLRYYSHIPLLERIWSRVFKYINIFSQHFQIVTISVLLIYKKCNNELNRKNNYNNIPNKLASAWSFRKPKITPLIGDIYFDNECNQVMTEFF